MKQLILIGAGGHAKSCIDVIERTGEYKIAGLIDLKEKIGEKVLGYPIIDCDENIEQYINNSNYFFITIGQIKTAEKRKNLFSFLKGKKAQIPSIISPFAYVSKHAVVKEGTIIMHGAILNAGVEIGENCIINTKALLEHGVKVGNNCHVSTSSIVNGDCKIGNEVFIGSNTTIVQGINIPNNSFIKAGSLIKCAEFLS